MVMDFLWCLRGSVSLKHAPGDEAVMAALRGFLVKHRKPMTRQERDYLAFNDPLWGNFFSMRRSSLALFDQGHFRISRDTSGRRLCYRLRIFHGMIFCLFAAVMFFLFGVANGSLHFGVFGAVLAFSWLYGMNFLIAAATVPFAVRRAVRRAGAR